MKKLVTATAFTMLFTVSARAIKLPDKETMQNRLASVTKNPLLVEHYFPLLLQHAELLQRADSEKSPEKIARMFGLALLDFAQDDRMTPPKRDYLESILRTLIPDFIEAILSDHPNKTEVKEAVRIWNKIRPKPTEDGQSPGLSIIV